MSRSARTRSSIRPRVSPRAILGGLRVSARHGRSHRPVRRHGLHRRAHRARARRAAASGPVLAARNEARVRALAEELGGLDWAVADVGARRHGAVRALVERGDVLLSTVGPFARWGAPAVEAAIDAGAHYLRLDRRAAVHPARSSSAGAAAPDAGVACSRRWATTGCRATWPGRWRCATAGDAAPRGRDRLLPRRAAAGAAMSGGTRASAAGVLLEPAFALPRRPAGHRARRRARAVASPSAARRARRSRSGPPSTSRSPGRFPSLRDVDVYSAGSAARRTRCGRCRSARRWWRRCPGAREVLGARRSAASSRAPAAGPTRRPGRARARWSSPRRSDAGGRRAGDRGPGGRQPLRLHRRDARVGARTPWRPGRVAGTGALGPVEAFGLDALEEGARSAGLARRPLRPRAATGAMHRRLVVIDRSAVQITTSSAGRRRSHGHE